jgi:hypothetical protein
MPFRQPAVVSERRAAAPSKVRREIFVVFMSVI